MKKYFVVFVVITAFTTGAAFAEDDWTPEKCFKSCMKEFKDKEICNYMCKDGPRPAESKMRKPETDGQQTEGKKQPESK